MSAAAVDPQDVLHSGAQPAGVAARNAEMRRNAVGLLKFHPDLLAAQGVGVGFQLVCGAGAPAPPNPDGHRRRESQRGQQAHHAADAEQPPVLLADLLRLACGDPPDLGQTVRFLFDDLQRAVAEARDDAPRQGGADPLDGAGGKIFADGPRRSGQGALDQLRLKLHSVGAVYPKAAGGGDLLALGDIGHLAHHRHQLAVYVHIQHGKAAFLTVKADLLHRPGYLLHLPFHAVLAVHRPFLPWVPVLL